MNTINMVTILAKDALNSDSCGIVPALDVKSANWGELKLSKCKTDTGVPGYLAALVENYLSSTG